MNLGTGRPGLVAGGLVTAVVLILVLGVFAVPAIIGAMLIGGVALSRGVPAARAMGLSLAGGAVLLVIGMVAAYLIVPTARVEFGRPDLLGSDARDRLFVPGTPAQSP